MVWYCLDRWYVSLGILAHLLRMGAWNLHTLLFGGDWRPQSSSDKVIGSLGFKIPNKNPKKIQNKKRHFWCEEIHLKVCGQRCFRRAVYEQKIFQQWRWEHTLSPIVMEVENGCIWKVTTIGGAHFWLPWLWKEGYFPKLTAGTWKRFHLEEERCPTFSKPSWLQVKPSLGLQGVLRKSYRIFGAPRYVGCLTWISNLFLAILRVRDLFGRMSSRDHFQRLLVTSNWG